MGDNFDREHLRRVFSSLSGDAVRAFDKIDDARLANALYSSALSAWYSAKEKGDALATFEWHEICNSLLK